MLSRLAVTLTSVKKKKKKKKEKKVNTRVKNSHSLKILVIRDTNKFGALGSILKK